MKVKQLIDKLSQMNPDLECELIGTDGKVKPINNIFVGDVEDINTEYQIMVNECFMIKERLLQEDRYKHYINNGMSYIIEEMKEELSELETTLKITPPMIVSKKVIML